MHATELIYHALTEDDRIQLGDDAPSGVCCVTGSEEPRCVRRADVFGKGFTDQSQLLAPDSDLVGRPAATAMRYKWERNACWWCDGEQFVRLDKAAIRDLVLERKDQPRPWAGYVTTSYKKHGSLRAPVNAPGVKSIWLFESRLVDATDVPSVRGYWLALLDAQSIGIPRGAMLTLDMSAPLVRKIGARPWMIFRDWARKRYRDPLYSLMVYLLPSMEEREAATKEVACTDC